MRFTFDRDRVKQQKKQERLARREADAQKRRDEREALHDAGAESEAPTPDAPAPDAPASDTSEND